MVNNSAINLQNTMWQPLVPQMDWSKVSSSNAWTNWGSGGWSWGSGTSSAKKEKVFDNYEEYTKVKAEENKKILELNNQKKEIKTAIAELDKDIDQINESKKTDGSAVIAPKRKEMTWGARALRTLTNLGKGVLNFAKGLIGYEADGSWNWKKCLKNVAITAVAAAACFIPVVGPFIGYGLMALGGITGTIGIVKSAKEINSAKTDEEKEAYIEGRIKAYSKYFEEEYPAIPDCFASYFKLEDVLMPGYRIAEKFQDSRSAYLD